MKNLIFLLVMFLTASSWAGWSSSGGEFMRDRNNPWFVTNTKEVHYCIKSDPQGFSASIVKTSKTIEKAFAFWKREFADEDTSFGVGTQTFIPSSLANLACRGDEPLTFYLGYNSLSEDQRKKLSDMETGGASNYLGLTVRTDYDVATLTGKGFVLLGSDLGDTAPKSYPTGLWSQEGLLLRILIHEIGHIYGVPHITNTFMAADYPEKLFKNFTQYRDPVVRETFFKPGSDYSPGCKLTQMDDCQMTVHSSDRWKTFELKMKQDKDKPPVTVKITKTQTLSRQIENPILVFLPQGQQVILDPLTKLPITDRFVKGPSRLLLKVFGIADGQPTGGTNYLLDLSGQRAELLLVTGSMVYKFAKP